MSSKTSLDKSKIKFLLLEGIHPSAVEVLHAAGYTNVESRAGARCPTRRSRPRSATCTFSGIRSRTQLTAEVFAAAHKLVAAAAASASAPTRSTSRPAREHGVAIFNAPYSNTRSVAELVLAEAILLLRGVPEKSAVRRTRGGWLKSADNAFEIRGKTLGIVGYGSIGAPAVGAGRGAGHARRLLRRGHQAAAGQCAPGARPAPAAGPERHRDLHVPETQATQWMIGAAEIAAMKPGSILINASRGTVVEIERAGRQR